jgi:Zn-dependent protease
MNNDLQRTSISQNQSAGQPQNPPKRKRGFWAIAAAAGLLLYKFKAVLIALKFGKFAGTLISMFVMIWVYATQFGALYAVGFVLLIAVHESGHMFAARGVGFKVSMPIFIPFVGAFISMKQQPTDARTEAIIAAGGPVLGSLGAFACLGVGVFFHSSLFLALAYTGCLLNLFNLIPVHPLDGGRLVSAISPIMWVIGIPILIVIAMKYPNPIVILLAILGVFQAYKLWKSPNKAYFAVSRQTRITFATLYFGLMIVLGSVMSWIHGLQSAGSGGLQ